MGKYIPVDPEKWAAMVIAQSDLVRYKEMCDELDAECTRLKDENARLRSFCTRTIIPNIDLEKEITRLKAEVERLTNDLEYREDLALRVKRITDQFTLPEVYLLRAQVDRLTKAGDCLVIHIEACYRAEGYDPKDCDMIDNWNAAKEGKQP